MQACRHIDPVTAVISLANPGAFSPPAIPVVFAFGVVILAVSAARLRRAAASGPVSRWLWRATMAAIGVQLIPLLRLAAGTRGSVELTLSLQALAVANVLVALCALEWAATEASPDTDVTPKWRRSPRALAMLCCTAMAVMIAPLEMTVALGVLSLAPLILLMPGETRGGLLGGAGRPAFRFGTAVAVVIGAWLATAAIHPALEQQSFMLFIAAVALAAAIGGLGPGVLATLLSIGIIDFFFLSPRNSFVVFASTDLLLLGVFTAIALLLSGVGEALRAARRRALDDRERALGMTRFLERQLRLSEELRGSEIILSTPIQPAKGRRE